VRAVKAAADGVVVVDTDEPEDAGELIRISSAGVCASDFAYIGWGSEQILGHELAGVTQDGRAVVVEGIFGCGACERCDRGEYNLCTRAGLDVLGLTTPGGMSEWFRAPTRCVVALPDDLPVTDASLVEPGSVAWHGCRVADVGPDTRVAIVGAGAIGLLAITCAQAQGATDVALEARHPHQREVGERLGATIASGEYDVVLEMGGSASSLARAVELARPGGTVVVTGVHQPETPWPYTEMMVKQLHTISPVGYSNSPRGREFDDVAQLLARRPEIAAALITHRFPIDDAAEAFRVAGDKSTGALRVVIHP